MQGPNAYATKSALARTLAVPTVLALPGAEEKQQGTGCAGGVDDEEWGQLAWLVVTQA